MFYTVKPDFGPQYLEVTCNADTSQLTLYWLFVREALFGNGDEKKETEKERDAWLNVFATNSAWVDGFKKVLTGTFNPKTTSTRPMKTLLEPQSIVDTYGVPMELALLTSYICGVLGVGGFDLSYKVREPFVKGRTGANELTAREVVQTALALKFHDDVFKPELANFLDDCRRQVQQGSLRADGKVWYFDMPTIRFIIDHFRSFCEAVRTTAQGGGGVRFNYDSDYYMPTVHAATAARIFKLAKNEANEQVVDANITYADELIACSNILDEVRGMYDDDKQRPKLIKMKAFQGSLQQIAGLLKQVREAKPMGLAMTSGTRTLGLRCPVDVFDAAGRTTLIYDIDSNARPFSQAVDKAGGDHGWSIKSKAFLTDAFGGGTMLDYQLARSTLESLFVDLRDSKSMGLRLGKNVMASIRKRLEGISTIALIDFLMERAPSGQVPLVIDDTGRLQYRVKGRWLSLSWLCAGVATKPDGTIQNTRDLYTAVLASLLQEPVRSTPSAAATVLGPMSLVSEALAPAKPRSGTIEDRAAKVSNRAWEWDWDYIDKLQKDGSQGFKLVDVGNITSRFYLPSAFAADGKLSYSETAVKYEDGPIRGVPVGKVWEYFNMYRRRFIRLDDLQMAFQASLLSEMLSATAAAEKNAIVTGDNAVGSASIDDTLIFAMQQFILRARDRLDDFITQEMLDYGVTFEEDRLFGPYVKQVIAAYACTAARIAISVARVVNKDAGDSLNHLLTAAAYAADRKNIKLFLVGSMPKLDKEA